jgi:hypothetical protein
MPQECSVQEGYGMNWGRMKAKKKYTLTAARRQDLIQVITGFLTSLDGEDLDRL